jgi:signal transduction histidine kinase/DNA-binding response OmpR family regulator
MKTILVLAQHPELGESIRSALNPEQYRIVHRISVEEADPLLNHSLLDACVIDADLTNVQALWMIEKIRHRLPRCPLLVFASAKPWEWEEEAYLQGVKHVLGKPLRPRMFSALVENLWPVAQPAAASSFAAARQPAPRLKEPMPASESSQTFETLNVLRDFSSVLTHSLNAEGLLRQFLLLLRKIIGVNRSVVFLRQPAPVFGQSQPGQENRRLRSVCAMGIPSSLLEHFELSFEAGIGGHLYRQGRILRREYGEVQGNPEIQKEFELLGVQVAIPILDRETLVGVAAFDGRLTGDPLSNTELELVFHLLEALGLALRNIWLHDQLASNHEMMVNVLHELSSGCIVIGRDLAVLHANKTARRYFSRSGRRGSELEFSDFPQVLGSRIYQVLKTGTAITPFKYSPPDAPNTVYQVTVVPFQSHGSGVPNSALLVVEDHSQAEQLHRLEIEAANLRLVKHMADRLAHEVGNALVPISTHQQLLAKKYNDPEFRASLDTAMAEGVRRITRLIDQMRFLAKDAIPIMESVPLPQLIEEAYLEAQKYQPVKSAQMRYNVGDPPIVISGDRASLKHAVAEVMLNALQANPNNPRIAVQMQSEVDSKGTGWVHIEFQDNGAGFTPDAAKKVPEPFYTTRNVGLGLGLMVSHKILERHQGKLEVVTPKTGQAGIVRLTLPLERAPAVTNQ